MKNFFLILLLSTVARAATGDFLFEKKAATGYDKVLVTPQSGKVLGFDGSGNLTLLTASSAWADITGKPTTLGGYGITDAQPLSTNLTSWASLAPSSKQDALTLGNLTEATSSVLTITGGTSAIIGSGLTIQVKQASSTQDGYLSASDWLTFNSKQGAIGSSTTLITQGLAIAGAGGLGYVYLKNQTAAPSAIASGDVLYSDASGNPSWKDSGGTAHIVQGTNQTLALGGFSSITGTLPLANIAQGSATSGQVLAWNGTAWTAVSTGITIGSTGISGGTSGRLLTSGASVGELTLGTGVSAWLGLGTKAGLDTLLGVTLLQSGGALGTPSSGTLTSCTGLPISAGVSGLGTGVATALAATPNASGGVLTFGFIGTSGTKLPLLDGANTFSGASIFSVNGAASTPALKVNGTVFTGGSSTTTKPLFLVEPSAATSTGWATSGTLIGVNAASGFTGSYVDIQSNGTSVCKFTSSSGLSIFSFGNLQIGADTGEAHIGVSGTRYLAVFGGGSPAVSVKNGAVFGFASNNSSNDVMLVRDAANVLALKNSTTAQEFRVYGTTTGSKYLSAKHDGTNGIITDSGSSNVIRWGTGTPEGSVTAPVGSLYLRKDGGASTTLYIKESGSGNTGWIAK